MQNSFRDNRLGQNQPNLTNEQKMLMRFKRLQQLKHTKSKFDINDDNMDDMNTLKHKGNYSSYYNKRTKA